MFFNPSHPGCRHWWIFGRPCWHTLPMPAWKSCLFWQPAFKVNPIRCDCGAEYMECHCLQLVGASVLTRKTCRRRQTKKKVRQGPALRGPSHTRFPEMDSRLGADYNGARFSRPSPQKTKREWERGRGSQSITCHCLSLDGRMMDDCIFSNNTKTLPVWEAFCRGAR